jgi:lipoprotein-releasing system permease protein
MCFECATFAPFMNLPLFISRRIAKSGGGSFSSTIHRIAVISVSMSLAALIVSFFVLFGFKGAIKEKVYNLSGHLTVNKYALSTSFEESTIVVEPGLIEELTDNPEIERVQKFILKAGLLKTDEEVQGVIIKGVGTDFDTAAFQPQMVGGSFPVYGKEKYSTDVAISLYMAKLLRLEIGDQVTLFFAQKPPRYRRIKVVGIYTTGMEEFDQRIIFGDIAMLAKINDWGPDRVNGLEVFLEDESRTSEIEDELFETLNVDLNVISAARQYPQIFEWLELLNRNVLILLIIIIVVAALGMISMVLILIMERTRMIGMMKALGAQDSQLRNVFFYSGLDLIVKGLMIGNGVGLLLCWLQYQFKIIPLDVENYYMHFVPISFDWLTLLGLNAMMITLVGLTLFIPVRIVSSVRPVQAIRFD